MAANERQEASHQVLESLQMIADLTGKPLSEVQEGFRKEFEPSFSGEESGLLRKMLGIE